VTGGAVPHQTCSAAIYGCAGPRLEPAERRFFRDADPLGFILFARNVETPDQVRALVDDLRDCVGRGAAFVAIDQEGGRVARLKPPHWRAAPPAARFGALYARDKTAGLEAVRLNARLLADELHALGIDIDCAPVLDLRLPGAHDIIGDRSFGAEPGVVAALSRAACEGFLQGGVLPVIKHVPGHGRARQDSHKALPVVETPRAELERTDFAPFRALSDMPLAMTAHVVYSAIDPAAPATVSPAMVGEVIRGHIGYDGLLMSDDLSMEALSGGLGDRATTSLRAGCDIVLHCNGKLAEMEQVAAVCGRLSADGARRAAAARALLCDPVPEADAADRLKHLLDGVL
jgi:beta-N-acetylhexosaminidase